ncbi:hypothetical protein HKX48_009408, partial [Thoreauomyces humboldtii]
SNRKRFIDVGVEQESVMARQAYNQVMAQYHHRILPSNHPLSVFVQKVADKLVRVSNLQGLKWEVHVIDDPQRNAFVLPGGKIFVFSGLIPIVRDADGMAAVLGHEIAHQIARHSAEKLSQAKLATLLQLALSLFDAPGGISRLLLELGIMMPFSRKMEGEADYIGLRLMAQACYDPRAAVGMWERMKAVDGGGGDNLVMAYVSTHPSNEKRIEMIKGWLPEAEAIRESSDCRGTAEILDRFRGGRVASW